MEKEILEELVISLLAKNYLLNKDNKKLHEKIDELESNIKENDKAKLINSLSCH